MLRSELENPLLISSLFWRTSSLNTSMDYVKVGIGHDVSCYQRKWLQPRLEVRKAM